MLETVHALYVFALAWVLALLEVQIEGPDGWAAKLPTWRIDSPLVRTLTGGKPVTGYFVLLNLYIILFCHWPFMWCAWSWTAESALLACYFSMIVAWDSMWFLWNPHFGIRRFKKSEVWWFRHWVFGVPAEYPVGIVVSFAVYLAGGWHDLWPRALEWARYMGVLVGCVGVSVLLLSVARRLRRRKNSGNAGSMGEDKSDYTTKARDH